MALLRQLETFDSIYGLDDEQKDLLRHVSNDDVLGRSLSIEGSYIFTSEAEVEGYKIQDLFVSEYGDYFTLEFIKLGKISGSLRSLRVSVKSTLPELLVKEIFFDAIENLSKILMSLDLNFIKLK
jgi:hypothetical protein